LLRPQAAGLDALADAVAGSPIAALVAEAAETRRPVSRARSTSSRSPPGGRRTLIDCMCLQQVSEKF
jgi:hypothetical protein